MEFCQSEKVGSKIGRNGSSTMTEQFIPITHTLHPRMPRMPYAHGKVLCTVDVHDHLLLSDSIW